MHWIKKSIFGGCMAILLLIISACTGSETTSTVTNGTGNDSVAVEQTAMKSVNTVNGEVLIPKAPQRVVATYYVGELSALGIKPVGTVTRLLGEASPNLAKFTEGVVDIGETPNLEAIAGLQPDLIIATDFDGIDYETYAKIAPTVIVPWSSDDVWNNLRTFANIFGKEKEAEDFIKDYDMQAVAAKESVQDVIQADETLSIIRFFGKSIRVYGGRDIGHAFYNGLGIKPSELILEEMEKNPNFTSTEDVSLEEIAKYAADRMVVVVTDSDGDNAYKEAQKLAIWSELPAVKNNKVYEIPAKTWFTYDPISVGVTLEEAVHVLTGAVN
ncbi:ABC transporter substrate-binding protein [Paenibacillus sp. DCT19]|uniref:ABC transporter substrate-binding protein n=1 Tax=Paenibacillus sp. DCT19 TaxID=2211212 RepID=UPI0013E382FB|nr:ABC transporter substrate-binding protein [Paenibacillus sp. DCT19]